MSNKLQSALWCVHQIICARRIKKPRHPEGLICAELNATIELQFILQEKEICQ